MRSQGWGPNSIVLVSLLEEEEMPEISLPRPTEKRPSEDTVRRRPSTSQEARSHQNQSWSPLGLELPASKTVRKEISVV